MATELHTKTLILTTKILETKEHKEQAVPYTIEAGAYDPQEPLARGKVSIYAEKSLRLLGWMTYHVENSASHVQIARMHNTSSCRHVGTALFEYAFKKSIEFGMDGRVGVDAIENAPGAYFHMGFRRKTDLIPAGRLIQNYLSSPTSANREALKGNSLYKYLVEEAATNLNKQDQDITVDEAIHHGIFNKKANSDFEALLASHKAFKKLLHNYCSSPSPDLEKEITSHPLYNELKSRAAEKLSVTFEKISFKSAIEHGRDGIEKPDRSDCYRLHMQGQMCLPNDTIAQKKIEFGITAPTVSSQAVAAETKVSATEFPTQILETKQLEAKKQKEQTPPYTIIAGTYDPTNHLARVTVSIYAKEGSGWMKYHVEQNDACVCIDRMNSNNRDITTALFEYAFRKSSEVGMGGRVELNAIEDAADTYFRIGFRRKNDLMPPGGLIQNYLYSPTPANRSLIEENFLYPYLVRQAAENLNKEESKTTFDEVVRHGIFNKKANAEFEALLASRKAFKELLDNYSSSPSPGLEREITSHPIYPKLKRRAAVKLSAATVEEISFEVAIEHGRDGIEKADELECYQLHMQGWMYLPDDTIAQKKIELGIMTPMAASQNVVAETNISARAAPSPTREAANLPVGVTDFFTRPVERKSSPIPSPAATSSPTPVEPAASTSHDCINFSNRH